MTNDKLKKKKEHIEKAEKLQDLLLDNFIKLFQENEATATDRATAIRFLTDNGWDLDPARVPQELKDKLTRKVEPDADLEAETGQRQLKVMS